MESRELLTATPNPGEKTRVVGVDGVPPMLIPDAPLMLKEAPLKNTWPGGSEKVVRLFAMTVFNAACRATACGEGGVANALHRRRKGEKTAARMMRG